MELTKDDARILSLALEIAKYDNTFSYVNGVDRKLVISKLNNLQTKLSEEGKDKRRNGRTSEDTFQDCIRRFVKR